MIRKGRDLETITLAQEDKQGPYYRKVYQRASNGKVRLATRLPRKTS